MVPPGGHDYCPTVLRALSHCATVQRALSRRTVPQSAGVRLAAVHFRAPGGKRTPPRSSLASRGTVRRPSLGGATGARVAENRTVIRRIAPCCGAPPRLPADRATISLSHHPECAMPVGKNSWVESSTLPLVSPASLWSALYDGPSLRSGLNDGTCLQTLANSPLGEVFDRATPPRPCLPAVGLVRRSPAWGGSTPLGEVSDRALPAAPRSGDLRRAVAFLPLAGQVPSWCCRLPGGEHVRDGGI